FEKAGAIIAAREAIVRTADGELLLSRAHECLAGPFSAAVIVDRIDVIEARDECAPQHSLAAAGGDVPPAFSGPAFVLLVADRDADPVAGIWPEAKTGPGGRGGQRAGRHDERPAGKRAPRGQAVQRLAPNSCSRGPVFHPARTQPARRSEKSISRELLRTVNEDRPEVVHVGQRRTRRHQIAKFLKEFRRIVVV